MKKPPQSFRLTLRRVIFGVDTRAGRFFDIVLMVAIFLSVLVVMLDSIEPIKNQFQNQFYYVEWFFTFIFTIEYLTRIYSSQNPKKYIFSFFGLIDLLSIIPSYLSIFFTGTHYLLVIRIFRILRVFRVLKLVKYIGEANYLLNSIKRSVRKITVFLFFIVVSAVICGSVMYLVEGSENGFTSIPRSIYWAIVTMTTVGYGDISPRTPFGQTIAAIIMIMGYAIIAVPTGIISAELSLSDRREKIESNKKTKVCSACQAKEESVDAEFCKFCGEKLNFNPSQQT